MLSILSRRSPREKREYPKRSGLSSRVPRVSRLPAVTLELATSIESSRSSRYVAIALETLTEIPWSVESSNESMEGFMRVALLELSILSEVFAGVVKICAFPVQRRGYCRSCCELQTQTSSKADSFCPQKLWRNPTGQTWCGLMYS